MSMLSCSVSSSSFCSKRLTSSVLCCSIFSRKSFRITCHKKIFLVPENCNILPDFYLESVDVVFGQQVLVEILTGDSQQFPEWILRITELLLHS